MFYQNSIKEIFVLKNESPPPANMRENLSGNGVRSADEHGAHVADHMC